MPKLEEIKEFEQPREENLCGRTQYVKNLMQDGFNTLFCKCAAARTKVNGA